MNLRGIPPETKAAHTRGPKENVNRRILQHGSEVQAKGDSRNHGL